MPNFGHPFPLDQLSDEAGLTIRAIVQRIKELQLAGICSAEIPIVFLITKGVRGDARLCYERLQELEGSLLTTLVEGIDGQQQFHPRLSRLATLMDSEGKDKLSGAKLLAVLEGWKLLGWIKLKQINRDTVTIRDIRVSDYRDAHKQLVHHLIELFYAVLEGQTGARLRLEYDLTKLMMDLNERTAPQVWSFDELEKTFLWMSHHKLIRLADGANLFQQAMKIKVTKGANTNAITRRYPDEIYSHYEEQIRRTHVMLEYGSLQQENTVVSSMQLQTFINKYFSLSRQEFGAEYPNTDSEAAKRPVTQDEYDKIIQPLNPIQKQIVLSEKPAMAVIAGPGSGKTRTIVHRIAYLIKVKRVDPSRIIALAYNRNAVRELRIRLIELIGPLAGRLRVYTFHGLALSLLGRTLSQHNKSNNNEDQFRDLIEQACDFIRVDETDEDGEEDRQARLVRLFGNTEYIFVDEYQDVAEHEYNLVTLIAGFGNNVENPSNSVQINLCVIGDDDQNIYRSIRATSPEYIRRFRDEFNADQYLLVENYRSTESIITAANTLISRSPSRCKQLPEEQVRIDNNRAGLVGCAPQAYRFNNIASQGAWICELVQQWLAQGIPANEIAILGRQWAPLNKVRALLDRIASIPTVSLKSGGIRLIRNRLTQQLISALEKNPDLILSPEESVLVRFESYFKAVNRNHNESTVQILLRIAQDIDNERGFGNPDIANSIAVQDVISAIYEFNENPSNSISPESILVTSCHGAKGLEFRKVILLTDGFSDHAHEIEEERRLFFVAMTRAKEELHCCSTQSSKFLQEAGIGLSLCQMEGIEPPEFVLYLNMNPDQINLGFNGTREKQSIIRKLREGEKLKLEPTQARNLWTVRCKGKIIGCTSRTGTQMLREAGIDPRQFRFQDEEITVGHIYNHLKIDEITREVMDSWYVILPQIRICRF